MMTRDWVREMVVAWRTLRTTNDISDRALGNSLQDLREPVGLDVFVLTGQTIPVTAVLVLVRKSAPDLQVRVRHFGDEHEEHLSTSSRAAFARLWSLWANMRANWTPARPPEPPEQTWRFSAERIARGFEWLFPGEPSNISPQAAAHQLLQRDRSRTESPSDSKPASPPTEPHVWSVEQDREAVALRRWLQGNLEGLMGYLGFNSLWWYGVGLSRRNVLGPRRDGDIDLLAGPLRLMLSEAELDERVRSVSRQWPLAFPRSLFVESAQQQAASDGLIQWPPSTDDLCAIEVKVSWFDPTANTMKAAHRGSSSRRRIVGQLQALLAEGIPRVGFLQLVFTRPRLVAGRNPWFDAAQDANDAQAKADPLYDPDELPDCLYLKSSNGALPFDLEDMAGAGPLVMEVRAGRRNSIAGGESGNPPRWKRLLEERLRALPRPQWPKVRIVEHGDGTWAWG